MENLQLFLCCLLSIFSDFFACFLIFGRFFRRVVGITFGLAGRGRRCLHIGFNIKCNLFHLPVKGLPNRVFGILANLLDHTYKVVFESI